MTHSPAILLPIFYPKAMYETENQKFMIAFARMHMRHMNKYLAESVIKLLIVTDVQCKLDESYVDTHLFTPKFAEFAISNKHITY